MVLLFGNALQALGNINVMIFKFNTAYVLSDVSELHSRSWNTHAAFHFRAKRPKLKILSQRLLNVTVAFMATIKTDLVAQ